MEVFSKQRRDRKAFRLITSSVRQFDINIHFLKASVPWLECQVMNMVKTSRQGFLFGTIIYHHFVFEESLEDLHYNLVC